MSCCLLFRYHQCARVTASVALSLALSLSLSLSFIVTISRSTFVSFLSVKSLALNISRSDKHSSTFPPYVRLHVKCVMLLADFKYIRNFSINFSKTQIPNFMKTCSVDVDSHADRHEDGRDHISSFWLWRCQKYHIRVNGTYPDLRLARLSMAYFQT